jgi:hypothetical protein
MKEVQVQKSNSLGYYIFRENLKALKKKFGKQISHLAPVRKSTGEIYLKVVSNKTEYKVAIPDPLEFNSGDWDYISEFIEGLINVKGGSETYL